MALRAERFAKVVQQTLGGLLLREIKDPRVADQGLLTITHVQVSDDLSTAKVYVTLWGADAKQEKQLLAGLEAARPFLQRQLGRELQSKKVPTLRFYFDHSLENVDRVEKILHEIETERVKGESHPADEE